MLAVGPERNGTLQRRRDGIQGEGFRRRCRSFRKDHRCRHRLGGSERTESGDHGQIDDAEMLLPARRPRHDGEELRRRHRELHQIGRTGRALRRRRPGRQVEGIHRQVLRSEGRRAVQQSEVRRSSRHLREGLCRRSEECADGQLAGYLLLRDRTLRRGSGYPEEGGLQPQPQICHRGRRGQKPERHVHQQHGGRIPAEQRLRRHDRRSRADAGRGCREPRRTQDPRAGLRRQEGL